MESEMAFLNIVHPFALILFHGEKGKCLSCFLDVKINVRSRVNNYIDVRAQPLRTLENQQKRSPTLKKRRAAQLF